MRFIEPTAKQVATWEEWITGAHESLRVIANKVDPWTVYKIEATTQIVTLLSLEADGTFKVTVWHDSRKERVAKTGLPHNTGGVRPEWLKVHTGSIPTRLENHVKKQVAKSA